MGKTAEKTQKLYDSETGCCQRFDPAPWQEKEVVWKDKLFLKDSLFCLFYMPLGFDKLMTRDMEKIASAGALAKPPSCSTTAPLPSQPTC
jgi:hypothetical protein